MKITNKDLANLPIQNGKTKKIIYADGREAYIFQNTDSKIQNNPNRRYGFPPINRSEPMRTAALKKTLNKAFTKILEIDLYDKTCLSLTLTIRDEKYNSFDKISNHFKCFTNKIRFHKKINGSYIGAIRFIEVQEKGFFHIHCILVFNSKPNLTWKELHHMWSWGFVKVKYVYDFISLIDYLTNYKNGSKNENNDKFTKYPKGRRVVYICPTLPKAKNNFVDIDEDQYLSLISNKNFMRQIKRHRWYDPITQKLRIRIDKLVLVQIFCEKEAAKK